MKVTRKQNLKRKIGKDDGNTLPTKGGTKMKDNLEKKLQELKQIYPSVVNIVNSWQMMAQIHGDKNTNEQDKILSKYVKILQDLGVLEK